MFVEHAEKSHKPFKNCFKHLVKILTESLSVLHQILNGNRYKNNLGN